MAVICAMVSESSSASWIICSGSGEVVGDDIGEEEPDFTRQNSTGKVKHACQVSYHNMILDSEKRELE